MTTKTVVWTIMAWVIIAITWNIFLSLTMDYRRFQDARNEEQIAQENIELKCKRYGTKSIQYEEANSIPT